MKKTNRYISALAGLIDHASVLDRKSWARHLRVSEPAITYWLQEESVPQPVRLKRIMDKVGNSKDKVGLQYLDKFMALVDEPVEEVSNIPGKFKKARTISEYLLAPNQHQLNKTMTSLPHRVRTRVLEMTQQIVAESYADLMLKGKSVDQVLDTLTGYEAAEHENETIMQIFTTFYVLLIKAEPGQLAANRKDVLKKVLSEKHLIEADSTGAMLRVGDKKSEIHQFKDIQELLKAGESAMSESGQALLSPG